MFAVVPRDGVDTGCILWAQCKPFVPSIIVECVLAVSSEVGGEQTGIIYQIVKFGISHMLTILYQRMVSVNQK